MRVFRFVIIIIYLMSLSQVNAANITGSNTINSDSTTQQVFELLSLEQCIKCVDLED